MGILIALSFAIVIISFGKQSTMNIITDINDLKKLFPTSKSAIKAKADTTIAQAKTAIQRIIDIPDEQRTFANTAQALDQASTHFSENLATIQALFLLSPDANIRSYAQQEEIRLSQASVDIFEYNQPLYQAFKYYVEHKAPAETLTAAQQYFLNESMKEFKRAGLELAPEKQQEVAALVKQLAELCSAFEKNINESTAFITATENELDGLDKEFIASLKKDEQNNYILGTDYPTYFKVMENATNAGLRKRLYALFNNRAWPANYEVLQQIISLRDQMATLLGYKSYSDLSLENAMAKTPTTALEFLEQLRSKAQVKAKQEHELLRQNIPEGIKLSPNGKLYPWDTRYVVTQYKKNNLAIDEEKIAEYFPMEHTIEQLLSIYQTFFNLTFKETPLPDLWDPELKLIEVHKNDVLLGYLLLDLYPREGKFSHAAKISIINAQTLPDTSLKPAVAIIIANFPKSLPNKPSLLKRNDVKTFFHEFGHGIHALLGATALGTQSGTHVKGDFVELPSQMLEEWLADKEILTMISKHYQTGQTLPTDIIERILKLKTLFSGDFVINQGIYAQVSLDCYLSGGKKDFDAMYKKLYTQNMPYLEFDEDNHFMASFGHLTSYGPKYYGYLWSQVYALDLFDTIKKVGLLNPAIGKKYADIILAPGGSKDPNELLKKFLGREPNQDAFLRDLGFK